MVDFFLRQKVISWMITLLLAIGGVVSFFGLGQLEFPEFTIRNAIISTQYPGATPEQVEEEVTLRLEKAIQQMPDLKRVSSVNADGLSQITVELENTVREKELDQYWDLLRRKINDAQVQLPPGAGTSIVNDDFGDVFGLLLTLTGADYGQQDLEDHADLLQRELRLVEGVKKVAIAGTVQEQVVVSLDRDRMKALGISPQQLSDLLNAQNVVGDSGHIKLDGLSLSLQPTGEFDSVEALEQLVVGRPGNGLIRLGDIAEVSRELSDTPQLLYHAGGQPALSIGISFASGVNVVEVGERVEARLAELSQRMPLGMELETVYHQPHVVEDAVNGFLINLAEAVGIVILVLLLFMGVRSGLLMGLILLLTILGTFIMMSIHGIQLQKISLGALIIALGMLVDNAIVVTEGMLIGMARGKTKRQAALEVVGQNRLPLLGATVIAITAFAPIGLSPDATGEFVGSLFWVLCYSLFLSWITALTLTPFFFDLFFKDRVAGDDQSDDVDPYRGLLFRVFRRMLVLGIRFRYLTLLLAVALLAGALSVSGQVKNAFFPDATTPLFFADVWLPEGTDILDTERTVERLEQKVLEMEGVTQVTSVIGGGAQRFTLTYAPEDRYASFGQLIVETRDRDSREARMRDVIETLRQDFPRVQYKVQALQVGPSAKASIEARIYGDDPETLRELGAQVRGIFQDEPMADSIRLSWSNRESVIVPEFLDEQARRVGVTRDGLQQAFRLNNDGEQVGVYREGSELIPIVMRSQEGQRHDIDNLGAINVWSEEQGRYLSAGNVLGELRTELRDPLIKRRDRRRMLAVYAEPMPLSGETAASVLGRLRPQVEAIELPPGYAIEWGGEYETASEAQQALLSSLPMGLLGMFIITVLLFGRLRQSLAIWSIVPLMMIGIIGGLALLGAPFTFMALLGTLSLIGMVLKNAIVLMEEINVQRKLQDDAHDAVVQAAVSRVRPVTMAAITTMLGMLPLFTDAFFASMAVVIVFGLGVATLLTLVMVPVVYCTLMRIRAS
ncbi:efflux RND transporter permease subunit [Halomonas denitrificans]|uniref:efflux RND transporter permease subunit n=1 Tax=Halomonas TaxID=2745 RepID=UPI001C9642C8|nr:MULTISPECIES: efflux RND transporter permease subunit [Halomonas]MBY6030144.1 efflux RND transporter permease subunit [Halomonas sp. DP8Y7-1]MCA0975768.1 efflux RND transporter permease subunit [Halomonas denitrificans]